MAAESTAAESPVAESTAAESTAADAPAAASPVAESPAAESPAEESPAADVSAPTDESAGPAESAAPADAAAPRRGGWKQASARTRASALLMAAACVLAGLAIAAALQAHSLRSDQAGQNTALTDAAATRQVQRQVASAIDTVFSYNYADTGATRAAAQRLLTGPAVRQYDSLFKLVEQDAPAQHLVLTTKVTSSGVELLERNRARVLIFADQRDTRTTTKQTTYAGAMIAVNAVEQGGRWKIENIDTFTGG